LKAAGGVDTVEVRARVTGFVQERRIRAGDTVKQGDVLYLEMAAFDGCKAPGLGPGPDTYYRL